MLGKDWTRVDIEEIAWRPSGDGRFEWFGPQNYRVSRFSGLGLKTRGTTGATGLLRWMACGAIAKLVSRRSKVVKPVFPFDAPRKR